jgi:hypothetical protein
VQPRQRRVLIVQPTHIPTRCDQALNRHSMILCVH